ncbi:ABC transporter substrate-binding protein [Demequina salsinemoris]|uniref:ABC transporter substrate-binding protein n=1 Tax=Demequina salsinemoris TaxID=577470 RepID=UPI0007834CB0|nr:ABC transporter substrate-binding protein [Demequina salsinemoris]
MSHSARIRRGSAATAGLVAGALLLAACSGSTTADTSASSSGEGSAEAAGAVSTLKVGLDFDSATYGYDPHTLASGLRFFYEGLYDSLFTLDEDGNIVPGLVTDYSYSEDGMSMTLDLDSSATFTDGSTLTAELVKANLDARDDAELTALSQFAEGGSTEITDVVVVDEDTVTLEFAEAQSGFEGNLVMPSGAIIGADAIADRSLLADQADGSGPLTIDEAATVKGTSYVMVTKEGREGELPFASYEMIPMLDPQARINSLASGDLDVAGIETSAAEQAASLGVDLVQNGGSVQEMFVFDKTGATVEAFGDLRVRQALMMSLDRQAIVDALSPGSHATANALPMDSPGYDTAIDEQYAYDPEAAKALLEEAGYGDGFEFEMISNGDVQTILELMQAYWAEIGVTMTLKNASSTEEIFAAVQTMPLGSPTITTWTNPAGFVFGAMFGFMNPHGAENPELEAAAGALGAAETDEDAAAALLALNHAITDNVWLMPLYEELVTWGYSSDAVAEFGFPGIESTPRLQDIEPAV